MEVLFGVCARRREENLVWSGAVDSGSGQPGDAKCRTSTRGSGHYEAPGALYPPATSYIV